MVNVFEERKYFKNILLLGTGRGGSGPQLADSSMWIGALLKASR